MTKLPAKELLDGTKEPETTTGEFRLAMGNLRQFLFELFGDESADKETARLTMGIDVTQLNDGIASKADKSTVDAALEEKAALADLSLVATTGDYNHLVNKPNVIVSGMIIMWSGSASTIPEGWLLCNGQNGTPDLRDRFIIGAGGSYAVYAKGGATTATLSGNTGSTTLTISQIPSHTHNVYVYRKASLNGDDQSSPQSPASYYSPVPTDAAGGGQAHAHSLSGTVSVIPPYYALCFIMKK